MTDGSSRTARRRPCGRQSCGRLLTRSARRVESLSSTLIRSLATQLTRLIMRDHDRQRTGRDGCAAEMAERRQLRAADCV